MSLVEVDEATEIIHEAAGEDANVILGAVVDNNLSDEVMVTVIATGFNRRGGLPSASRVPKAVKVVERIPTGVADLQKYDEPAYIRRGVELNILPQQRPEHEQGKEKIDKSDPEKPAFLRKIMD
jgi:cell division protein FtsZ